MLAQLVFLIGYGIVLVDLARQPPTTQPSLSGPGLAAMTMGAILSLVAFGWQVRNRWVVGGQTGQSLGKRAMGMALVSESTQQPIGPLNACLRDLLHILDGVAALGYLWPLWDEKRQTFADKLMRTVVVDLPAKPPPPPDDYWVVP